MISHGGQRRELSAEGPPSGEGGCAVPARIFSVDGGHAALCAPYAYSYTSFTFFSGNSRTGLPIAAWIALSTAGATTQMVGSPTPPQKS